MGAPAGSFNNDTSNAKHVYNFLHSHTQIHAHTHAYLLGQTTHTNTHSARLVFVCVKIPVFVPESERENKREKKNSWQLCCQSSHRNWKFLYKLQLLCYNIPFHNCLSHMPRPVLLFCASAWRQFRCAACIIVSKWTDCAHAHTRTHSQTNAQLCPRVCVSGSVRVCVCVCGINMCLLFMLVRAI